jgi:hypothetical protein
MTVPIAVLFGLGIEVWIVIVGNVLGLIAVAVIVYQYYQLGDE